jgi:hypothetical protein
VTTGIREVFTVAVAYDKYVVKFAIDLETPPAFCTSCMALVSPSPGISITFA